jgi:hypothetical protein
MSSAESGKRTDARRKKVGNRCGAQGRKMTKGA